MRMRKCLRFQFSSLITSSRWSNLRKFTGSINGAQNFHESTNLAGRGQKQIKTTIKGRTGWQRCIAGTKFTGARRITLTCSKSVHDLCRVHSWHDPSLATLYQNSQIAIGNDKCKMWSSSGEGTRLFTNVICYSFSFSTQLRDGWMDFRLLQGFIGKIKHVSCDRQFKANT